MKKRKSEKYRQSVLRNIQAAQSYKRIHFLHTTSFSDFSQARHYLGIRKDDLSFDNHIAQLYYPQRLKP